MKKSFIFFVLLFSVFLQGTLPDRKNLQRLLPPIPEKRRIKATQQQSPKPKVLALVLLQQHGPYSSYTHINDLNGGRSFIERIEKDQAPALYCLENKSKIELTDEQKDFFIKIKHKATQYAKARVGLKDKWVATVRYHEDGSWILSTKYGGK